MTDLPLPRRALPRGCGRGGPARRRLRRVRRHADRAAARRRHRPRRLPDQLRRRPGAPPRGARAPVRPARAPLVDAGRARAPRARRVLRGPAPALRRRARRAVPAGVQPARARELARVEYGTTTTYGTLAAQAGNPRAARAVGTVMNRNPIPIILPCHRVIGASGNLTGYAGGLDLKERLLRLEGRDPLARYGRTP